MIGTATNRPTMPNSWPTDHDADRDHGGMQADGARHHQRDDQVALYLLHDYVDDQHRSALPGESVSAKGPGHAPEDRAE